MQCSYAYKKKNSVYIFCSLEGASHGTSNSAISPYLCSYQDFPPNRFGNEMNITGWPDCPKLKESESHEKTILPGEWFADGTYSDYPYKATIAVDGASPDNFPYVEFQPNDQESGNFADVCISSDNVVYIFCKEIPSEAITVNVYLYVEEVNS